MRRAGARRVATVVALGALAAVIVAASLTSAHRMLTPAEARRSGPRNGSIEVMGTAMRITRGPGDRGVEFILRGGGANLRVRYRGVPPDGLRAGANVSVTGQMRAGELIAHAGGLHAGCGIHQHC